MQIDEIKFYEKVCKFMIKKNFDNVEFMRIAYETDSSDDCCKFRIKLLTHKDFYNTKIFLDHHLDIAFLIKNNDMIIVINNKTIDDKKIVKQILMEAKLWVDEK